MEAEEKAYHEQNTDDGDPLSDEENYGKGCRAKKYRKLEGEAGSAVAEPRVRPIVIRQGLLCFDLISLVTQVKKNVQVMIVWVSVHYMSGSS